MVAAFDFCLHGRGGAAPSIDTAMHGLVEADHVDHLHPDSGIALATAADGEDLTRRCFGDRVAWVGWRRPGFQLGLDMAEVRRVASRRRSARSSAVTASRPGATRPRPCEARSLEIIRTAERFIADNGRAEPFGGPIAGYEPLPEAERHARAAALLPLIRGLASTDRPQVGHYTDSDVVLDFVGRAEHPRLAALGTSCPDHFLRTKVRPMVLDLPPTAELDDVVRPPARAARGVPRGLRRLLRAPRDAGQPGDARCRSGHRPRPGHRDVLVRGEQADRARRRRVLRQRDQRHARRRGAVDLSARSTSPRSSGSSTGRSRRPSSSACPSRSRWPAGSRS